MAWKLAGFDPLSHLGSGSTGVVMKARDWTSGLPVTIKYLSKEVAGATGFADQFREDAAALVRIDSPHVAQVYGYIEEPQGSAVVTEFIDGLSLQAIVENAGALEPQSALYVLKGALAGLAEAHRRGVTHRDVKPANLLIDKDGVTKVVDFGIAARYRRNAPASGNPNYMAPELWVGRPATPASDVFAVTSVLFEALTGAPPKSSSGDFLGKEGLSASDTAVTEPLANLPERLRALITRGLAAAPSARFPNATDMLDTMDLAALAEYGTDWEDVGKAALLARMVPLFSRRPAGVGPGRVVAGALSRGVAAANKGVLLGGLATLVVAASVVYVITAGTFNHASAALPAPPIAPPISHTPIPQVGPSIPTLTPATPGGAPADRTKPQRPTGLRITGRSQTAISLDWNPATDNVKVVGYAVSRNGRRIATTYTPGYTDASLSAATFYQFSVVAFDAAGNISLPSASVSASTLKQPDTTPPTVPGGLHVTGRTTTTIVLDWNASRDDTGVSGYDVFRNGSKIATVTRTGFTDTKLAPNTTYSYSVRAFDTTLNASHTTGSVSAKTLAVPDTTPPTSPQFVTATSTGTTTIEVTWSKSSDNVGVTGYQVIRDGTKLDTVTGLVYEDSGLTANTSYTYQIVAIDAAGNASAAVSATAQTDQIPAVTSLSLTKTAVTAYPDCSTTLTVTVHAVGGLPSVGVAFSGAGVSAQTVTVSFNGSGVGTATLPGDGTVSGNVKASVPGFSDTVTWSPGTNCVAAVASVTFDPATVADAPDCTTQLTVHVHANGGLGSADVDFTGTGITDQTVHVTFDGSGDATATVTADGNVDGSVTASSGGHSDVVTWTAGVGCPA